MHQALHFLIWCTAINYAILIVWFVVFIFAHDWLYRMHTRWFKMPVETFDSIHYAGIAVYKIGILLLNLVPLIALHFV
ncbi:MAG: hypothetical protein QM785_03505 [Pyrinomonadaceae bacterium]